MNTATLYKPAETIDYGPCAFMYHYDPAAVFHSKSLTGPLRLWQPPRLRSGTDAPSPMPVAAFDERDKGLSDRSKSHLAASAKYSNTA